MQTLRYRLLIFDFDGTLADSFPTFLNQMRQVAGHFGFRKVNTQELDRMRALSAREIIKHLGIPYWKMLLIARYMRRLMTADTHGTRLFPEVPDLLRRLREQGALLAIVNSNSKQNVQAILGPQNALLINIFQCGASLFGKATKFRKVMKQAGVSASQAIAIGDEIRDLDAAREAGIAFGAVSWGYTKVEALRATSPEFVFNNLQEIEDVLTQR